MQAPKDFVKTSHNCTRSERKKTHQLRQEGYCKVVNSNIDNRCYQYVPAADLPVKDGWRAGLGGSCFRGCDGCNYPQGLVQPAKVQPGKKSSDGNSSAGTPGFGDEHSCGCHEA